MQEKFIQNILEKNEQVINFLKSFNDLSNQTILLVAPDETYLNIFAKFLACKIEEGEFNPQSVTYKKLINESAVDVFYYPKEKQLTVENANEIIDNLFLSPLDLKNKFYIIKNIENATIIAQNKLLKSLEEPPKSTRFILLSTNLDGVLNTIKSRATKLYLPEVDEKVFTNILESLQTFDNKIMSEQFVLSKELSNKKLGTFFEYLNCAKLLDVFALTKSIVSCYSKSTQILEYSSKISNNKANIKIFFELLNVVLRDLLVYKTNPNLVLLKSELEFYKENQNNFSSYALTKQINLILNAQKKLKYNAVLNGVIDNFLIEFMEAKLICK